jgi:hypothetical protein
MPPIREFPDRGVKWLLESPDNVRGLLQVVAADIAACVDFTRLELQPGSLIPDNLHKQEADVVFRAPFRSEAGKAREVLIYILIEHQSTTDPSMPFRVLFYMVQLWDRQRREWVAAKVPESEWRFLPILPVLFYTGSDRWEIPGDMASLMDLPEVLMRFVPRHDTLCLDLKRSPRDVLLAAGNPLGWLMQVMQKEDASLEELDAAISDAVAHMEQLPDEEYAAWAKALWFLYLLVNHRREPEESRFLTGKITADVRAHRREAERMAQTMAEVLMEEGEKRGLQKGWEKGLQKGRIENARANLLRLMRAKFPDVPESIVEHVHAMDDVEALELLMIRVLNVDTIEEMNL